MLSPFAVSLPNQQGDVYPAHEAVRRSLNPEQQQMIETKQIMGSKTATDWIEFLNGLVLHDRALLPAVVRASNRRYIIAIGLVLIIVTTITLLSSSIPAAFMSLIITSMLAIGVVSGLPNKLHKLLFPDYLYTVLTPLMQVLQEETEPTTLINLKADLHQQFDMSLRDHQQRSYQHSTYEWPLLSIAARLHNQADFRLKIHIQNLFRERKSKSKRRTFIYMTFLYPKKVHPTFYPRQQVRGTLKITSKDKPKRYVLRLRKILKYKDKPFNKSLYQDVPMRDVLEMMREGYKAVRKEA
mgnify:CR=1 FL=1